MIDPISRAIDAVAGVRDRLERETANMADRSSRQLIELDEAIARVRAERERVRIAVEEERVRLERLGLEESRLDVDQASAQGRAERLRRKIAGQQRVVELLEADVVRSRESAFGAAVARGRAQLRSGATRRERRTQLEQSRAEIARCSAEHASALAALEATPARPEAADDLAEIATRRERVDAELAAERQRRAAIPGTRETKTLADRAWQERRQTIDAAIARLDREREALDTAELDAQRGVAEHEALLDSLRREVEATRSRVLAANRRFELLERSLEDDDARTVRSAEEASAAADEAALVVRHLELALPPEQTRMEQLRRELELAEAARRDAAERRDALRREIAEERQLQALMRELASLEVALAAAVDEHDALERLVGRMRTAAFS